MKDSKEKEHRISNLKDMIDNISNDDVEEDSPDEMDEDIQLINYLNENQELATTNCSRWCSRRQ